MTFINEKHNEVVHVEQELQSVDAMLTELSNELYKLDPEHPLLDDIRSASQAVTDIDFEGPYKAAKAAAGESWWDEG